MSTTTEPVYPVTAMDAEVEIKALAGLLRQADPVIRAWALGCLGHLLGLPVVVGLPGDAVGNAQLFGEAAMDALSGASLAARNSDAGETTCKRCPLVPVAVAEGRHRPPDSMSSLIDLLQP